jgi:hypothetical protein
MMQKDAEENVNLDISGAYTIAGKKTYAMQLLEPVRKLHMQQ